MSRTRFKVVLIGSENKVFVSCYTTSVFVVTTLMRKVIVLTIQTIE